jgi:cell division protein FtsL
MLLGGAITLSVLALVAWFPASALFDQHQQLSSASAQLNELQRQDRALQAERVALTSPAEVARIARQQYQLIVPGSRAFAVLPPNGGGSPTSPYAGDPGFQAPVAPADAQLPAGSDQGDGTSTGGGTAPNGATAPGAGPASSPNPRSPSLVSRILQTLEFWR